MSDEIDLWCRFVDGDKAAFSEFYEQHHPYVFGYCLRRTASWHDSEDVTAEVFAVFWSRRGELEFRHGVRPLLGKIAFGQTSNYLRKRRKQGNPPKSLLPEDEADPAVRVAAQVDAERMAAEVLEILSCLTRVEREAFVTPIWLDLTLKDSAEVLGIRLNTLKSRRARADKKLRKFRSEEE